jgi:hypothetical protein
LKNISRNKQCALISKYVNLIIAEKMFGLNKEQWDLENDIWKLKEFYEL